DPERVRARGHGLVSTSEEFRQASWANAASGNAVPVDLDGVLGTASHWTSAQARDHALDLGMPWWRITPFAVDEELADIAADMEDRVEPGHVRRRRRGEGPPTPRRTAGAAGAPPGAR